TWSVVPTTVFGEPRRISSIVNDAFDAPGWITKVAPEAGSVAPATSAGGWMGTDAMGALGCGAGLNAADPTTATNTISPNRPRAASFLSIVGTSLQKVARRSSHRVCFQDRKRRLELC